MSYTRTTIVSSSGITGSFSNSISVTGNYQCSANLPVKPILLGCTANATTEVITATAHGLVTLDTVIPSVQYTGAGAMPTGLTDTRSSTYLPYYVIKVNDDTLKLATSAANALAGTAVNITANGGAFALIHTPLFTDAIPLTDANEGVRIKWLNIKISGGASAQDWFVNLVRNDDTAINSTIREGSDYLIPGFYEDQLPWENFIGGGGANDYTKSIIIYPSGNLDAAAAVPAVSPSFTVDALYD